MAGPGLRFIVGLSVFGLLTACGDKPAVEKERPRVFVQEVKLADYAASVTLTGDVQARVQTDLSFRVGGKIISEQKSEHADCLAECLHPLLHPQASHRLFSSA